MVKVLVVDNDKDMCRVISDVLEEEGIKVNIAYKGEDALEKLKRQSYDFIDKPFNINRLVKVVKKALKNPR